MSAIALEEPSVADRLRAQPQLAWWIGASVAIHLIVLIWVFLLPDQEPMTLSDQAFPAQWDPKLGIHVT